MTASWTTESVLALAPDASAASAGQSLASASKWSLLARSERAIWGLCQGSGKDPYQVRVDLSGPVSKCSCPSRKFPCKHALALMLLVVKSGAAFKTEPEPGWVSEWLAGRAERAEKKAERAPATEKPVDPEARAARQAKREQRVAEGVAQCRVWLEDLVRRGLAQAQTEPERFWELPAARMVDAQAPGLAAAIRRIGLAVSSGEGWHERTLDLIGRLHLLLSAAERIDTLPSDLAEDTRVALGRTQSKEDALAQPGVADRWVVAGQITEEEDRLRIRRTWLVGRSTARRALLLEFAVFNQPMDASLVIGTEFDGEVSFYPSRQPLRAIVKSRTGTATALREGLGAAGDATCAAALERFTDALACSPWLSRWPMMLQAVTPQPVGEGGVVRDRDGVCLPLRPGYAELWRLVSLGGGRPLDLAAEWDGEFLYPLAVLPSVPGGAFEDVAPRWAA